MSNISEKAVIEPKEALNLKQDSPPPKIEKAKYRFKKIQFPAQAAVLDGGRKVSFTVPRTNTKSAPIGYFETNDDEIGKGLLKLAQKPTDSYIVRI